MCSAHIPYSSATSDTKDRSKRAVCRTFSYHVFYSLFTRAVAQTSPYQPIVFENPPCKGNNREHASTSDSFHVGPFCLNTSQDHDQEGIWFLNISLTPSDGWPTYRRSTLNLYFVSCYSITVQCYRGGLAAVREQNVVHPIRRAVKIDQKPVGFLAEIKTPTSHNKINSLIRHFASQR